MGMFSQTRTRSPIWVSNVERIVVVIRHTVPVGNVLVCDAGRHVEHDDAAVAVDVVSIAETTKLLLTGSIPDIELDLAQVLQLLVYGTSTRGGGRTVENPRGWTSTPRVAMYFFSNSPVK
jgi:hypothetical protein